MYLGTVMFFIRLAISVLAKLPLVARMKRLKGKLPSDEFDEALRAPIAAFAAKNLRRAGCRAEVSGLGHIPKDGPVLFVGNHQSDFDIALMLAYVPRKIGFVSKMSIGGLPVVSGAMKLMDSVFMDRDDPRQSLKAILAGIEILKGGNALVIYPEGTRSKDGRLLDFKPGSFKLATKSGAAIVPVTVDGTRMIMEANGGRIKRASVRLTFHAPVISAGLSREEEAALPEKVKAIIESALTGGAANAVNH